MLFIKSEPGGTPVDHPVEQLTLCRKRIYVDHALLGNLKTIRNIRSAKENIHRNTKLHCLNYLKFKKVDLINFLPFLWGERGDGYI